MITDEERLRTERADRKTWKSRVTGIDEYAPQGSGYSAPDSSPPQRKRTERRAQRPGEDDLEYRLAIEASINEAEEDKKRRESRVAPPGDDEDLAKAIRLSKEEEELRRRELEESNATSLFDDTPAPSTQPQYTGYNQGYQQQGAVDWFGNPVGQQSQQQQPQTTGYLNNAYSQPGFQSQPTGFQNGFQPQQTGFDPSQFHQQQQQQPSYMQPQPTIQPQQTAYNMANPYSQQTSDFGNQYQQQQPTSPVAGSHNPWASNQQPQLDSLKPAPTGSNNPFGASFGRPQIQQQQSSPPTLNSLAEQKTATQFNNHSSYNPITNFTPQPSFTPQPAVQPQKEMNPQHARLNALLASGEGMDTFGNTGESRIPAQHTAPGTFVNSAGQGLNKLHATQTGNNPFFSQQFTGAPQNTGFGFQQQQQNRMMPAQTGPAGLNVFGGNQFGNNPFGAQQHQQQQTQGGGSLIDL